MAGDPKKNGLEGLSSLIKDVESSLPNGAPSAEKPSGGNTSPQHPEPARPHQKTPQQIFASDPPPSDGGKKAWPKVLVGMLAGVGLGAGLLFLLQQQGIAASGSVASATSEDVTAIRQEIDALKIELTDLKKKQASAEWDNMMRDFERVAFLRPGDEGYSAVRFDLGVLTVSLVDITPYANGTKVQLQFGNPLSSTVNGLKTKLEYGHTDEKGVPDNANAKSKDVTFNEALRPGAWTTVSVVLDGVKPSDLGFVRVKEITHTGISLSR